MFQHDSFFGFLNMFSVKLPSKNSAKTPYPAIKHDPSPTEIFANYNMAELGLFLSFNLLNAFISFNLIRRSQRKISMKVLLKNHSYFNNGFKNHLILGGFLSFGFMGMNSIFRLKGITNNGLKWKFKDSTAFE